WIRDGVRNGRLRPDAERQRRQDGQGQDDGQGQGDGQGQDDGQGQGDGQGQDDGQGQGDGQGQDDGQEGRQDDGQEAVSICSCWWVASAGTVPGARTSLSHVDC